MSTAVSVIRALASHARCVARELVRAPRRASSAIEKPLKAGRAPDMAKMRCVTPIFDPELQRWVIPVLPDPVLCGKSYKPFPI